MGSRMTTSRSVNIVLLAKGAGPGTDNLKNLGNRLDGSEEHRCVPRIENGLERPENTIELIRNYTFT